MNEDIPGSCNDGSTDGAMSKRQYCQGFHDPTEGGVAEQVSHGRHDNEYSQELHQDDGTAEQIENLLEEDESVDDGPLGGVFNITKQWLENLNRSEIEREFLQKNAVPTIIKETKVNSLKYC